MTDQDIRDAFGSYLHPVWKVVGLYKAGNEGPNKWTCDNYNLFMGLYFRVLKSYGFEPTDVEKAAFGTFITRGWIVSGLPDRFPGRREDISQDEIYGIASCAPGAAFLIFNWGRTHWWSYNIPANNTFSFDTFLGRFPCFTAYVRVAGGERMWLWSVYWFFGFVASAFTNETETTGKLLSYLQIPIMQKKLIGRFAIWIWKWKMNRTYPGGFRDVCGIYFGKGHPFYQFARSDFN